MVLPTAVLSLYCAALSVTNDPFAYVLAPAIGYLQTGVPVALLIIGVSGPVILARAAARHGSLGCRGERPIRARGAADLLGLELRGSGTGSHRGSAS